MTSEHIYRDWTGHSFETIRPNNEYCGVEIYSFDHQYTKTYHRGNYSFKGENKQNVNYRHMSCIQSENNIDHFTVELDYNCLSTGDYRIDILYENKNGEDYISRYDLIEPSEKRYGYSAPARPKTVNLSSLNKKVADKIKKGLNLSSNVDKISIDKIPSDLLTTNVPLIAGTDLNFDGEPNCIKQASIYESFKTEGKYTLYLDMPVNTYFVGVIIRKIKLFTGDSIDSAGTNLELTECDATFSDMVDSAEASFTIGYSQYFDNNLSRSGFFMDYMDEVNIYYRENDSLDKPLRRFGGYISSVTLDDDRTTLKFDCADRLQDGEDVFILDSLSLLYGTSAPEDFEYYNPINFNNYGQVLKYLCNIFPVTLKSNISRDYLVEGEEYSTKLSVRFGKNKDIKKVSVNNMSATVNKNSITLRNNASGKKQQSVLLYDGQKYTNKPIDISNHLTFSMSYGLGATKSESKSSTTETVDNSENSAGSQKFNKCGVSADGKYVMGIGRTNKDGDKTYPYSNLYRRIFKNKCPACGKATLRFDGGSANKCMSHRSLGYKKSVVNEHEITCINCDCDFDIVRGKEKEHTNRKLTPTTNPIKSSQAEFNKLVKGKMVAVPTSNAKVSSTDVLKAVANIAKKYKYDRGHSTTYSSMKKTGIGDCHAFSDLIWTELKKYNVSCRIYEYTSSYSNTHQSVMFLNAKNQWESFPYKKYGLSKMLYPAKNLADAMKKKPYKNFKGTNISNVTTKSSNKTTQTTTVTETKGYDKDNPIQGYIQIRYSTDAINPNRSFKGKTKVINLDFTQKAGTDNDLTGLTNIWVNNSHRKTSVSMEKWFKDNEPNRKIYLHQVSFIAPKIKTTTENDKTDWYTYDKSTHDNSSCKMILYQIIFDDNLPINPTILQSCGKTVISMMKEIVEDSGYLVEMEYGQHRCDDKIKFRVDNDNTIKFHATEGDNNNILEWTNISYSPVADLKNKSICVFKDSSDKYSYVDTADMESMLKYGVKTTLTTVSEKIGAKEAYYNARNSKEYNPDESYTYTIIVPYAPKLRIGDLVEVISNYRKLNDVKTVKSIKINYKKGQIPRIRTEIGLDEIEPFLRIRKEQEALRKQARSDKKYFGRTATPITDSDIYVWD